MQHPKERDTATRAPKDTEGVGIVASGGHPRRECPHLNYLAKGKGSLGALKVGKGKGRTGKGGKGQGKHGWGKGSGYQYRSLAKGAGKGFNQMGIDWHNAWGT